MKNETGFKIPFSGFTGMTFINCFASAYVFIEKLATGSGDYECKQRNGDKCDGCGNCRGTPAAVQERWFFLFDTMCGRSALRLRFDGSQTEMQKLVGDIDGNGEGGSGGNIDFLFGFAGYAYSKLTEQGGFMQAVAGAVDAGRPVIARIKSDEPRGRFRLICGYDGETLICPDFANAQNRPETAPGLGEIDELYVFGEKTVPRYTLKDGLERIKNIMEYNIAQKLWDTYTCKVGKHHENALPGCGIEEKKERMKRIADTMWHVFNCHNFAETFRQRIHGELQNPALDSMCDTIDYCCDCIHDLAWAVIGFEKCADWTMHEGFFFGEMIDLTLKELAQNDEKTLDAVKKMLAVL